MRPKSKVISFTNISPWFWPVVSMYGPSVVCALSPASYLKCQTSLCDSFQRCVASLWTSWRYLTCSWSRRASSCRTWWTTCGGGVRSKASTRVPLKNWPTDSPPGSRGKTRCDRNTWSHLYKCCMLNLGFWCVFRKEPSSNTVAQVWVALLSQTRQESGDHSRLSETCSNTLIQPLTQCLEYTQRLAKKVLKSALWGESAPAECSPTQECNRFDSHPCAFPWLRNFVVPWVPSRFCHHN